MHELSLVYEHAAYFWSNNLLLQPAVRHEFEKHNDLVFDLQQSSYSRQSYVEPISGAASFELWTKSYAQKAEIHAWTDAIFLWSLSHYF